MQSAVIPPGFSRARVALGPCLPIDRSCLVIAVLGVLLVACQHGEVSREVGARCDVSDECDERCLAPSVDYPGGFCTVACSDLRQCPGDTTCADLDGGVCLFRCASDPDCAFLGADWRCTSADLRGGGIKVMVCRGG